MTDSPVAKWSYEIDQYDRRMQVWHKRGKKIIKRYADERSGVSEERSNRYNALWSNVQTMLPAMYSRLPKPDIQRRFRDSDDVGRVSSDVLQRVSQFNLQSTGAHDALRHAVLDHLLPGRGQVWMRYCPTIEEDNITWEEVKTDYVHWQDFGHTQARTWSEVCAVWRKTFLTREELIARFGEEIGTAVPLNWDPSKDALKQNDPTDDKNKKAIVYEIWDKTSKEVIWISKEYPKELDKRADPLHLSGFFPCPKPLYATLTNEDLTPIPDFAIYQDQAMQLDEMTSRIASMTKSVKVVGAYDSNAQGIQRMLNEGTENTLIPVDSWAMFAEKGGLKGVIDWLPINDVVQAINTLYECREHVKKDMYEITGLSDLMRGDSQAEETATAQGIKASFVSMRFQERRQHVEEFVRSTLQIVVEIIAEHFQPETLKRISGLQLFSSDEEKQQFQQMMQMGQPMPPSMNEEDLDQMMNDPTWQAVMKMLHDNSARTFRIDVETDSIIRNDENQERTDRAAFLQTVSGFMKEAVPAAQNNPQLAPLLCQMLLFTARSFNAGRQLESDIEVYVDKLRKQAQQPQQPKPNPEMMKIQGQQQIEQAKIQGLQQMAQINAQLDQQKQQAELQAKIQLDAAQKQHEMQIEEFRAQQTMVIEQHKQDAQSQQEHALNQIEAQRAQLDAQNKMALEQMRLEHTSVVDMAKAKLQAETSVIVAQINAESKEFASGDESIAEEQRSDPNAAIAMALDSFTQAIAGMSRPKMIIHDESGKPIGIG
jgi:hypothetical protein